MQEAYFVTQNPNNELLNSVIEIGKKDTRLSEDYIEILKTPSDFPYLVIQATSYSVSNVWIRLHIFSLSPELKKIAILVRDYKPDMIVAIGGGAVIDYAKIVSVINNVKRIKNLIIRNNIPKKKNYPLIAIPTTSGSGAEVTPNAVIYISKTKYTVDKNIMRPNKYYLIPKLTFSSSKKIKASSGFDAVAQSIESLISAKSNKQSVIFAISSLKHSLNSYIDFVNRPNNFNAEKMSLAANISGKAITISKTTAPHAASYPFTSLFNISHGHAVSLFFENFFKFNYDNLDKSETSFDLNKRFDLNNLSISLENSVR
jgi:alcohol dehydrogenase class IV